MNDSQFEVRRTMPTRLGDQQALRAPLTSLGVPVTGSVWDYLALGGFMFNTAEPTIGTAVTGGAANAAGIVLTTPTVRLTVPSGTTVFPRRLQVNYEAAAGTVNEIAWVATDSDSFSTGGTALTPLNWRTDNPKASVVTHVRHGGQAITETTLGNARVLYQYVRPAAFTAGETNDNIECVIDDLKPIVGPASVLVYVGAATTAAQVLFAMDWAEVPSTVL